MRNYLTAPSPAWNAKLKLIYKYLCIWSLKKEFLAVSRRLQKDFQRRIKCYSQHVKDYYPRKPDLFYYTLDGNNLNGWDLSQSLPYKDIRPMRTYPNVRSSLLMSTVGLVLWPLGATFVYKFVDLTTIVQFYF